MFWGIMPLPALRHWYNWTSVIPRGREEMGRIIAAGCWAHEHQTAHQPPRLMRRRRCLIYLVAGSGIYRDGRGLRRRITPGDWIMLFPGLPHSYGPETPGRWHNVYISFEGPVFDAWEKAGFLDINQPAGRWLPPPEGLRRLNPFFALLERPGANMLEAVCHWQTVLADVLSGTAPPSSRQPEWLKTALDLLDQPVPASARRVREIATASGIGYETFRVKFRESIGCPPAHYALRRRIERARQILTVEKTGNKELAERLGFSDEFHFSKTFRRFTGMTPRAFRREGMHERL